MYFIFVSNDVEAVTLFENVLSKIDPKRILIAVPNGYDLIQFLQNVKKGESFPDLIILTPAFLRIGGIELLELLKTDDLYRLIPVFMLLPEMNVDQEHYCAQLGTEYLMAPKDQQEWMNAVDKMCASCA